MYANGKFWDVLVILISLCDCCFHNVTYIAFGGKKLVQDMIW